MHSEVRDRLMYECDGISELVVWLDSINRRPGLDELESKLISTEVNIPVLRECIGYSENSYQRNVIKKTEHYELVAICWTPGQLTPIHDHVGSDCAFKIIDGISTETIYELDTEGHAYPVKVREYLAGEICAADEPDIHRISNNTKNELINLHVYTPPLHAYNVYKSAN